MCGDKQPSMLLSLDTEKAFNSGLGFHDQTLLEIDF